MELPRFLEREKKKIHLQSLQGDAQTFWMQKNDNVEGIRIMQIWYVAL